MEQRKRKIMEDKIKQQNRLIFDVMKQMKESCEIFDQSGDWYRVNPDVIESKLRAIRLLNKEIIDLRLLVGDKIITI